MLTLLSEVKFLTSRDDINIKDTDFGAFKYVDKKSAAAQQIYAEGKQNYIDQRQQCSTLEAKKPKKIRGHLKKLEDYLKQNKIVYCAWSDNVVIQLLLSNGLLVHICVNIFTGDIIRMAFDKFFIGKLVSESITDAVITRMHILLSYNENQVTFVYLQKPNMKRSAPEKISRMDPRIFNIIINGPQTRKIPRHLACNNSYDTIIIWTKSSQNEVYPWRPTVRDQDRANLLVYKLSRTKLDLMCYYWTENDPINVEFSKMNHNQVRSVEQKISRKGDVTVEICVYEINKSKLQRASVTSIPLQSQVCCHSFSPDNEKLMLGCIDGAVVLFDEGRGITHLIKAAFIPTLVTWHADSALVMVANEKSQIQCFDISLACIKSQLISEDMTPSNVLDLSTYFTTQPTLLNICCSKKPDLALHADKYIQMDSFILLLYENGPLASLRFFGGTGLKGDVHTSGFTADVLIHKYLNLNNVEKAINVLLCLNWDSYGAMCLMSLNKIANYIFKQPLMPERELQLEKALGSFHVPVKPLCEQTEQEFGEQVRDITRKFFQYLLRYKSYEKAFNLAIDISDEDLFMDLYNCAKADGQFELATDAYKKAAELLERPDSRQSSHSTCSRPSCSDCYDSSTENQKNTKESPENQYHQNGYTMRSDTDRSHALQKPSIPKADARTPRSKKHSKSQSTSYTSSSTTNISKMKINIPKPELKVSSQSRSQKSATKEQSGISSSNQFNNNVQHVPPTPMPNIPRAASQDILKNYTEHYPSVQQQQSQQSNIKAMLYGSTFSADQVDHIAAEMDPLKYQTQKNKQLRSATRMNINQSYYQSPTHQAHQANQQHKVIDVVPKPMTKPPSFDWDVPDQTLGIPLVNPTPLVGSQYFSQPSNYQFRPTIMIPSPHAQPIGAPMFRGPRPMPLIKSKSLYNIPTNMPAPPQPPAPQIIHHPLVSGHIPPSQSFHATESYLLKRKDLPTVMPTSSKFNANRFVGMNTQSILSTPHQPSMSPKKENGEKNKVKFSDTVTVAVVPEIPRKDKPLIDRLKKQNGHGRMTDPRRELADSLPLCHPNDEYLKDFTPMPGREDQQPSTSSNVQEGVLTWV